MLRRIFEKLKDIQAESGPEVRFQWVPAHAMVEGNEKANVLAKSASARGATIPLQSSTRKTAPCALSKVKKISWSHRVKIYAAAKGGNHIKGLDNAVPGMHTKTLYDHLTRPKAATLAQMRTGGCGLGAYLHKSGPETSDLCEECEQKETVKYVLLDCKKWRMERQKLRETMKGKSRWGDLPYLLGGCSGRKDPAGRWIDGEATTWKPELAVVRATIDFAMRIGRFDTGGETRT